MFSVNFPAIEKPETNFFKYRFYLWYFAPEAEMNFTSANPVQQLQSVHVFGFVGFLFLELICFVLPVHDHVDKLPQQHEEFETGKNTHT